MRETCTSDALDEDLSAIETFLVNNQRCLEEARRIAKGKSSDAMTRKAAKKLCIVFRDAQIVVGQCRSPIKARRDSSTHVSVGPTASR